MPDEFGLSSVEELKAQVRKNRPPTWTSMAGDLVKGVKERVSPFIPEPVKGFGREMQKPLLPGAPGFLGGITGTEALMAGPAAGYGLYKGAQALRSAAPRIAQTAGAATSVAEPFAPAATRALPEGTTSERLFRDLSRKPILTPAEASQLEQLRKVVGDRASNVGLSYAAGGKTGFRGEQGAINPALLRTAGGAAGGAAIGGAASEDDPLKGAAIGGLVGASVANPGLANTVRINAMLSGRAIPLNIATAAGASGRAAIESGSLRPITEMLRVPTNMRVAAETFRNPVRRGVLQDVGKARGPAVRAISAIDETARQALQRGGLGDEAVDRLLHTAPRPSVFGEKAEPVISKVYPFLKTPLNVIESGATEAANLGRRSIPFRQKALTVASVPAGMAVGELAQRNARKHPLATAIAAPAALAMLGPTTALGAIAALTRTTPRNVGSIGPMADWALDPNMIKQSYGGFKPAGLSLYERGQETPPRQTRRPRRQRGR